MVGPAITLPVIGVIATVPAIAVVGAGVGYSLVKSFVTSAKRKQIEESTPKAKL